MHQSILCLFAGLTLVSGSNQDVKPTTDYKDKRGTLTGTYGPPAPIYMSPDHSLSSAYAPIAQPLAAYPHTSAAPLSAVLLPHNLLYGHGALDYSSFSPYTSSYGNIAAIPPASYPIGLNYGSPHSALTAAYKVGPVTFGSPGVYAPYVPEYPSYSLPSYASASIPYSPSYSSGLSSYASHVSPYSSSPSYSSFTGSNSSPYSSYSPSPSSYNSPSSYSSYSSPSSSYSQSYSPSSSYSQSYSPSSSYSQSYSPSSSYSQSYSSPYKSSTGGYSKY